MRVRVRDGDIYSVRDYEACLTRVLEAISDLSAGMYVKVRDCDICQFVTVLNAVFEDYEICLTRVLEAITNLSAGMRVKVREGHICEFVPVMYAVMVAVMYF